MTKKTKLKVVEFNPAFTLTILQIVATVKDKLFSEYAQEQVKEIKYLWMHGNFRPLIISEKEWKAWLKKN